MSRFGVGGFDGFGGFDSLMFNIVPIFIFIIFCLVFGTIIFGLISSIRQHRYNRSQPVLTVEATVVSKRDSISRHTHHHGSAGEVGHHTSHSTSTTYYATFEVESGDRMEFTISGRESGMLVEGDKGRLTFQGTAYKGFERQR